MVTLGEYTELFMTVILGLGITFELPILVFFLALFGLVTAGWLWKNIRYAILVIFIIAAIITPTPDVLTMCVFTRPCWCSTLVWWRWIAYRSIDAEKQGWRRTWRPPTPLPHLGNGWCLAAQAALLHDRRSSPRHLGASRTGPRQSGQ